MALPLAGIRVVEMCQVYAGPYAAMMLADLGAEVIKVEPLEGDSSRGGAANTLNIPGLSIPFLTFNRNKRSAVVNIHTPRGREIAYELFRRSDVLIVATRVATRGRWGFTYDDVAAVNPRLIYASITGFGETGPDADLPGIDLVNQARSGDAAFRRSPDGPPPSIVSLFHFDMATAMLTVASVLAAMHQREHTGLGQKLELSLLQSALASHAVNMTRIKGSNVVNTSASNTGIFRVYKCSDGRYIYASPAGNRWPDYCRAMGLERLVEDPRFDTAQKRQQNQEALYPILVQQFATAPAKEWESRLKSASQYASLVQEFSEVYNDPQVTANQMLTRYEQPGIGTIEAVNIPFKMSAMASGEWFQRPTPLLGEHTQEVLEELGYTPEDLKALKTAGAIG